jgi:hypothetical protein
VADRQVHQHPSIYLLGDNLDAALATGEDLLTKKVALASLAQLTTSRLERQSKELREFVSSLRTLELAMTSRLLQARTRAMELKRRESGLRPLIALFVAGTAPLVDAAQALGDPTRDFDTGHTDLSFLRSRALVAPDAASLEYHAELTVTEDYLVMGQIRLGTLLDLVATILDTMDLLFDLYAEPDTVNALPKRSDPSELSLPAESGSAT